jgi:DNA-binding CsgD family transcriptional regulator/PAS domain-containing protein
MQTRLQHEEQLVQPNLSRLLTHLHHRRQSIVFQWFHALVRLDVRPPSTTRLRESLTSLTDQIVFWLCAPAHQPIQAKSIGRQLAKLSNVHPEALAVTFQVWSKQVGGDLGQEEASLLQSRLSSLFGELATGFVSGFHDLMQAERQHVCNVLVTTHRQLYQAFQAAKQQLDLMMRHAPVVVAAIDRAGTLTRLEGNALHWLKLPPHKLIGRPVAELASEITGILEQVNLALAGKPSADFVKICDLVFEARYEPIRDQHGSIEGVLCIAFAAPVVHRSSHTRGELRVLPPKPKREAARNVPALSCAELEVVQLLIQGYTNQQIAAALSLSKQGIAKRLEKLYAKLNVANRTQAVARVVRLGLLDSPGI